MHDSVMARKVVFHMAVQTAFVSVNLSLALDVGVHDPAYGRLIRFRHMECTDLAATLH